MNLKFLPMPTPQYEAFLNGELDAHNRKPSHSICKDGGYPCRHCLQDIGTGEEYLTLAYSPFKAKHDYAEVGPIFLHATECKAYDTDATPPSFLTREYYMIRGYCKNRDAIIEGTGSRVASVDIKTEAARILADDDCAYVHLRSATNTCFACRVERE